MIKPFINKIVPGVQNISIYLRSTKKFGKTTLFRDVILEKYGDPSKGLLIGCGKEVGYKILDTLNVLHANTFNDLLEIKDWLITKKGIEHNIEMVAFDTGDEVALLANAETIRLSNKESPRNKCRTIKGAFGGYTNGEKFSANDLIKPLINDLTTSGFGVWVISHTKFKTIKEKGSLDEDGYMQLTSNLGADHESAFGDIFDAVLTGVIERDFEEKIVNNKTKKYTTNITRKLHFRETPLIDAGCRFAFGAVPDYMVFDKRNMAKEFIQVIEEGMEKSKLDYVPSEKNETSSRSTDPIAAKTDFVEELDTSSEISKNTYPDNIRDVIRNEFKTCKDVELKKRIKEVINEYGKLVDVDDEGLKKIYDMMF